MSRDDDRLAARTAADFHVRYGRAARWVAVAPGRVNLIGEHTDYNDGFVLPMAIDRHAVIAADLAIDPANGGGLRIHSATLDRDIEIPLQPSPPARGPAGDWSNYLRGVVAGIAARGAKIPPLDLLVSSDVPLGGGLSSSAALEVAMARLLEAVTGTTLTELEAARLCQQAEHDFAGVPCGIMDQLASASGRAGAALLIDCQSEAVRPVPLPANLVVIVTNSGVKHALGDGSYARRRAECAEGARLLGVPSLRQATATLLETARDRLPEVVFRRTRHVVSENQRTVDAAAALERGDAAAVGALMYQSHRSLRDDFEVSCAELDALVDCAAEIGADGGVVGARMTGGGFGGCTVTLARADRQAEITAALARGYEGRTGRRAEPFVARAASGAHLAARLSD